MTSLPTKIAQLFTFQVHLMLLFLRSPNSLRCKDSVAKVAARSTVPSLRVLQRTKKLSRKKESSSKKSDSNCVARHPIRMNTSHTCLPKTSLAFGRRLSAFVQKLIFSRFFNVDIPFVLSPVSVLVHDFCLNEIIYLF